MPLYTITTSTPITPTQQQTLVCRITTIHCTFYSTPSSFVNVLFIPTPSSNTYYASNKLIPGGKTLIQGMLRPGESRTFEGYNNVIGAIADAYLEVVGGEIKDVLAYVTADVDAVRENGVFMPKVCFDFLARGGETNDEG